MRNLLAAALLTAAAVFVPAPAYADPAPDPHMPNMQAGYCPGGGMGSQISLAYCDGVCLTPMARTGMRFSTGRR